MHRYNNIKLIFKLSAGLGFVFTVLQQIKSFTQYHLSKPSVPLKNGSVLRSCNFQQDFITYNHRYLELNSFCRTLTEKNGYSDEVVLQRNLYCLVLPEMLTMR